LVGRGEGRSTNEKIFILISVKIVVTVTSNIESRL